MEATAPSLATPTSTPTLIGPAVACPHHEGAFTPAEASGSTDPALQST